MRRLALVASLLAVSVSSLSLAATADAHQGGVVWTKWKAQRALEWAWEDEFGTRPSVFCRGLPDYFRATHFRCRVSDFDSGIYETLCLHTTGYGYSRFVVTRYRTALSCR
jgi:hypothetical protein